MREGGATPIFSLWISHVGQARCGISSVGAMWSARLYSRLSANNGERHARARHPHLCWGSASRRRLALQQTGFAVDNALLYGPRQFAWRLFGLSIKNLEEPNEGVSTRRGDARRARAAQRPRAARRRRAGADENQSLGCGRRCRLPVLPADRAGKGAWRVRQGRPRRRADQLQGRLAGAAGGDRRLGRYRVGLLRPLRQPRRQGPVAGRFRGV
jgi:hypothetical protein